MKRPRWILNRTALAAHRRLLAEYGGNTAVDMPLLLVAIGWPKTVLAFATGRVTAFELAAAYAEGILRARPFASANERMAHLLALLFLSLNDVEFPRCSTEQIAMLRAFELGAIDRIKYAQWMLMRAVAKEGSTVVSVRSDSRGRVLGVGLLKRGGMPAAHHAVGQSSSSRPVTPPIPLLCN